MRVYLRGLTRAAIKSLRTGDCDEWERLSKENEAVISAVFNGLMSGKYDYAYTRKGESVCLYTRSAKSDGIQRTGYMVKGGEWIPLSDSQYDSAGSWIKDGYSDACYINVA